MDRKPQVGIVLGDLCSYLLGKGYNPTLIEDYKVKLDIPPNTLTRQLHCFMRQRMLEQPCFTYKKDSLELNGVEVAIYSGRVAILDIDRITDLV